MLKTWVNDNKKDLIFIVLCWFVISIVMFTRNWDSISNLNLKDNDDYMRYVQFTDWIKYGNWYLEPMARFNPEDGVIMHWSRVPDIPLVGVTLLLSPIVGTSIASLVAITITPLAYMLIFSLSMFALCDRYLGSEYRFIGMIFLLGSPAITKFLPGSIDHHNLQLIFATLFLLLTPLNIEQIKHRWRAMLQAFVIALSLWTGLENITLFVAYLALYTFYCYYCEDKWLNYFSRLCFYTFAFTLIVSLINRPTSEFFIAQYDAISLPFILCFLGGGVALFLSTKFELQRRSLVLITAIGLSTFLICFTPILILYPELIKGAYSNYPSLLLNLWLSQISEVQSMLSLIKSNGFFSTENYFLYLIPALLYPLSKRKVLQLNILYSILIIHLILAMFWQIRIINLCFILSTPLQVYVLLNFTRTLSQEWFKVPFLIAGIPFTIMIILTSIEPISNSINSIDDGKNKTDLATLLKEKNIINAKILSGIESGAQILAKTENSIIAAPYHRNIKGNTIMIDTFIESDLEIVRKNLLLKGIDYILINRDAQLKVIEKNSNKNSFINIIKNKPLPSWISEIHNKSNSDYVIFKLEF
ncbi:hypothetical protein [Vibrio neonatus]|uniref:hypothetical protein n=1 Tax=Vibrio neonatus TaxID=278860 RepID=UPI0021C25DD4|nr:hypothetical protein [Vibrio neonatus]